MSSDELNDLLRRWQAGDEQAAAALFERYAERLSALARSRLSMKLSHHIDPEDVVQSVYRSFFADARAGRYEIQRGGDLWQLLVTITLRKLRQQIRRLNTQKRDFERESKFGGEDSLIMLHPEALTREPTPVEAVTLADLLEKLMHQLEPEKRRVLELRLQGYNLEEIAAETRHSRRTVCRTLDAIKRLLTTWQAEGES